MKNKTSLIPFKKDGKIEYFDANKVEEIVSFENFKKGSSFIYFYSDYHLYKLEIKMPIKKLSEIVKKHQTNKEIRIIEDSIKE